MRRVAPFDPTQVAGCKLWLDGSDAGSITLSSGSVTQWNDKSGNNNTMTPYSSYSNVTISSAYQNQLNVLNFSGGGVYKAPTSSAVYPLDVYVVLALKDTTTVVDVIGINTNIGSDNFNSLTFSEHTTSRWHNGSSFFNRTPNTVSSSNETSTSFLLMNWSINDSNYILRRNGTQLTQTSSYSFTLTSGSIFQIGYRQSTGVYLPPDHPFKGYIAEIVAFNSQLATSQQQQVEGYLAQKWGLKNNLPAGHPGIITTIYPTPRTLSMTPRSYTVTVTPTAYAGCALWLDATDPAGTGVAPSNGSVISTWTDKSGVGNNGSSSGSPTYSTTGINSKPSISFDGGSQRFVGSIVNNGTTVSVFAVASMNSGNAYGRIVSLGSVSAYDGGVSPLYFIALMRDSTTAYIKSYRYQTSTPNSISPGYNTPFQAASIADGTTNILYINGTGGTPTSSSGNFGYSVYGIGQEAHGQPEFFQGYISEIIVYHAYLNQTQQQQIEGYLAWKWGLQSQLPVSHPYVSVTPNITTNPYNVTRMALPSALFPTPKTNTGFAANLSLPSYTNTNGLVSYFTFNASIADSRNTITLAQTGSVPYVTGKYGNAVSFTNTAGVAPYNYLTSTYAFPSTFTISLWFQAPDVSPAQAIVYTNSTPAFVLGSAAIYFAGGNLYCAYGSVANNGTGYPISANTWYNGIITYNNGTLALYANGTKSGSDVTGTNSKNGFTLGASTDPGPTYYPFTGYIDEVRIYNRVLSGSEITAIYNGTG